MEVLLHPDSELDYVALLPAYSSPSPELASADQTVLSAYLSDIEIINHDDKPTEIQSLWLGIEKGPQPQEERPVLLGAPRIGGRSRQHYRLEFTAVFDSPPREDWRPRLRLYGKAIGLGAFHLDLGSLFPRPIPQDISD